jgi:hypothetical protein
MRGGGIDYYYCCQNLCQNIITALQNGRQQENMFYCAWGGVVGMNEGAFATQPFSENIKSIIRNIPAPP